MQRVTYYGIAAAVLAAFVAAPIYSQTQRPRVRVSPQNQQLSGMQFGPGPVDANALRAQSQRQRPRVRPLSAAQSRLGSVDPNARPRASEMPGLFDFSDLQPGAMDPNMSPQEQFQQRMAAMKARIEQGQRWAEEQRNSTIRDMLKATDEQWPRIKPKLDQIDRLKAEAGVSANPGPRFKASMNGSQSGTSEAGAAGFVGGWGGGFGASMGFGGATMTSPSGQQQSWSFGSKYPGQTLGQTSDGQVLCEKLLSDLQTPGTPAENVAQRVAALRKTRAQAQSELALARNALRAAITPAQEPALVVMGYLD